MKRKIFIISVLAVFISSCSKPEITDNDVISSETTGVKVAVTATLPGETPETRVQLTEENPDTDNRKIKVEWKESGETFSVMTATSTAAQTFTQTEGNNFTGTLTDGWTQPYYAFYPAVTSATNATAVPYDLSTQTGALSEATNYMYAVNTTDGKEYNFQHLTAIVKFTLNLPSGYIPTSLSLVSDRLLAKGTVNLTGESVAYTNELSAHSITVENPTVVGGKITLYLHVSPMAASEASKNTLHIRTHSGSKGYSGSISTSKEIKAGKYYTATVDVTTHDYDYTYVSIVNSSYKVYSPWGLRAWGENTSMFAKCTLGDNDIDMGTLPNDIEMVGFAGNWTTTNKSGANQMFDGNNKTISNLRVVGGYQYSDGTYVGFIGMLGNNSTFKDVTFKGATVAIDCSNSSLLNCNMGVAVGSTCSQTKTISGVIIEPNPDSLEPMFRISGSNDKRIFMGAVVGYASGTVSDTYQSIIKDCVNNQKITVTDMNGNGISCQQFYCGGISSKAGNERENFIQCINNGDIDVTNVTVATGNKIVSGIAAMDGGNFIACANTGTISAPTGFIICGIGRNAGMNNNYGCYTVKHAATKLYGSSATLNGFYDSVSTDTNVATKVEDFNTDDVVNGMNAALVTYNSTEGLADTKKCDKYWAKSTDPNYIYPVLVEGAPSSSAQ